MCELGSGISSVIIFHLSCEKSKVLFTVWRNIYGEAAGEIWNWSLLGVKGLIDAAFDSNFSAVDSFALTVFVRFVVEPHVRWS